MKIFIAYEGMPRETFESYIVEKDWRDVIVERNGRYYIIEIITPERLVLDYKSTAESGETAIIDLPTVIADNVSKERVIELLLNVDPSWFDVLTPIDFNSKYIMGAYPHFTKIENLTCIYDSETDN
jgi:hypothetical protein